MENKIKTFNMILKLKLQMKYKSSINHVFLSLKNILLLTIIQTKNHQLKIIVK